MVKDFTVLIYSVEGPVIACYVALLILGVINCYRFIKLRTMSKNLFYIYFWSLLSNLSWALYFSSAVLDNRFQYPPFCTACYSKIIVGIAYQASIFDLKYVVQFYFKTDKLKLNEEEFIKKRELMSKIMFSWSVLVCVYYLCDMYFNYVR